MWLFDLMKCFAFPLEFDKGLQVFSLLVQATDMSVDELLQQSDPTPWKQEPVSPNEKRHPGCCCNPDMQFCHKQTASPSLMKCKSKVSPVLDQLTFGYH